MQKMLIKKDTNKIVYVFEDDFLRKRTDFTLVDVENHSGVAMEKKQQWYLEKY